MTFIAALQRYKIQFTVVLLLLAAVYSRIIPPMVQQWYQDENYSHGFIVPLIAGFFIYNRWEELRDAPVCVCNAGLAVILTGLLQLLAGWLGSEYFTMRSSMIVLLAGMILYFFGKRIFHIVSLSIAYLFFMIPIPYIIYDFAAFPLKLFVTRVSVWTMKMVGVVVMREGNIIMFPATTLEVADACSGIRSLLSLLALAVAFAFFLRITAWKRLLLICSAVPIAIFTNSVRVIITGILAQWWGEKAAEGFFHEFAGMAVFAVAIVMLVAVAAVLKRECGEAIKGGSEVPTSLHHPITEYTLSRNFLIVYFLLIVTGLFVNLHKDISVPTFRPFQEFPTQVRAWNKISEATFSDAVLNVLKPTDYISRQYKNADGRTVNLYIGYHGGGKGVGEIHSPKQCLPGSGWFEINSKTGTIDTSDGAINMVQGIYQKGENKELFLYWFQVRDKTLSNEYALKLSQIANSILSRRRDASFIRISLPFEGDETQALATGEQFVRDFVPVINGFLPK